MPPRPLSAPCKQRRAKHDSGPRRASQIRHIVIHSTEGGTAASVAAFFATTAEASTQLVVDDRECYRCVPDLVIPWGAKGANTSGLHIETCGFARWSLQEWMRHRATLDRSAYKAAVWCFTFGIPVRRLTNAELRAGTRKGFVSHAQCFQEFGGSVRTDPGAGYPWDFYLGRVRFHLREIRATAKARAES